MDIAITSRKHGVLEKQSCTVHHEEIFLKSEKLFFDQLIKPIEHQMMRSIWRIVRDPEMAKDAFQDSLAKIWKRLERIRSHPNPHALIFKICLNSAIDSLRKRKRLRQHEKTELLHRFPSRPDTKVHEALESKKIEAEIFEAINRLPRRQAVAVLMRIIQEQPYAVIAQAMECSETTVRIHVSRGRARLSQWLSHLKPASLREVSK
ncbi:MAG: RNA polymerase sigma factor [Candidatus Aminicenantes bacterium]|nr:MAG: RNA polymerase sigma factor [Candidatus Aminicenantes bacterium]